jgi:pyruvate kinase
MAQNKTRIVCTIGPACAHPDIMADMLRRGMNVARLNFSHGDFADHSLMIQRLRETARSLGKPLAIMADLSGPKIRLGELSQEPIELEAEQTVTLSTEHFIGDAQRMPVVFSRLPLVVKPGNTLFLNDGYIQLEVKDVIQHEVICRVVVGGEIRSRQGLNLPGIHLGISAFTERDHVCLKFALEHGVDAISQSFVEAAADIQAVRAAAAELGHQPFIIAKIERAGAIQHMDEILEAADGIMIARGDLGVEMPIEVLPGLQKELMKKANLAGKPVITATQMLESMIHNRRPTRAEATDVANAILDGTDCVMLSGESAIGQYPSEAVAMLTKIAAAIEPHRTAWKEGDAVRPSGLHDLIALTVETASRHAAPAAVMVPTQSGATARSIARFRLPLWITAISTQRATCQHLLFSYGVHPIHRPEYPEDWRAFAQAWLQQQGWSGDVVILTEGPSPRHPDANERVEIIDLRRTTTQGREASAGWSRSQRPDQASQKQQQPGHEA